MSRAARAIAGSSCGPGQAVSPSATGSDADPVRFAVDDEGPLSHAARRSRDLVAVTTAPRCRRRDPLGAAPAAGLPVPTSEASRWTVGRPTVVTTTARGEERRAGAVATRSSRARGAPPSAPPSRGALRRLGGRVLAGPLRGSVDSCRRGPRGAPLAEGDRCRDLYCGAGLFTRDRRAVGPTGRCSASMPRGRHPDARRNLAASRGRAPARLA